MRTLEDRGMMQEDTLEGRDDAEVRHYRFFFFFFFFKKVYCFIIHNNTYT